MESLSNERVRVRVSKCSWSKAPAADPDAASDELARRLARLDVVVETRNIADVDISAQPEGLWGWNVVIKNRRAEAISVRWDESSYVSPSGTAQGRLIRGMTKRGNTDREQPPTPIPPGASIEEWCIPERHVETMEQLEGLSPFSLSDDGGPGRLVLSFGSAGLWEGNVHVPSQQPPDAAASTDATAQ